LKQVGFDFLITANNHSNDTGEEGILRTIAVLDQLGIHHTGTYRSQADRDSIRILDIKGLKIAVLAYTYSTNGLALTEGKPWLVNFCDSALIEQDIAVSRQSGADLVLVFYHFGNEYERLPSEYQKQFVGHALECGADLILGSHPHVLQPVAFLASDRANLDSVFVAYSLGNFISNQYDEYTDEGIILNLNLSLNLNSRQVALTSADYTPTWVYRGKGEKKLHMVMPVAGVADTLAVYPDFITPAYKEEMKKAFVNTQQTMSTYTEKVLPARPVPF
jgi:poly-gamma-glutamate synthesis protein (capsule biosynthesis protein)